MGNMVVKHFKIEKPFILHYKTNFSENEYKTINIRSNPKRKQFYEDKKDISLKSAYTKLLKISHLKKENVLSLCYTNLIPEQYHYFYEQLLTDNTEISKPTKKIQKKNKCWEDKK